MTFGIKRDVASLFYEVVDVLLQLFSHLHLGPATGVASVNVSSVFRNSVYKLVIIACFDGALFLTDKAERRSISAALPAARDPRARLGFERYLVRHRAISSIPYPVPFYARRRTSESISLTMCDLRTRGRALGRYRSSRFLTRKRLIKVSENLTLLLRYHRKRGNCRTAGVFRPELGSRGAGEANLRCQECVAVAKTLRDRAERSAGTRQIYLFDSYLYKSRVAKINL